MGQYGLRAEDGRAIVAIMAVIGVVWWLATLRLYVLTKHHFITEAL